MEVSPLPIITEEETTTFGTGVVLLNAMYLLGIIDIKIDKDVLIHIIFAVVLRRRERPDLPPTISSVIPLVLR